MLWEFVPEPHSKTAQAAMSGLFSLTNGIDPTGGAFDPTRNIHSVSIPIYDGIVKRS